jgi:hypothetical protein
MRTVAIASAKGAPGVTTTALLLASRIEGAVVVEADPDGSSLAVRYGLGREPGLTTLAAATSRDSEVWREHAQDAGGVAVLVGPDAAGTAGSLWKMAGDTIAARLARADGVAVVDVGRYRGPAPMLRVADLVLVAVNPVADQLVALSHRMSELRSTTSGDISVLLVGAGPYTALNVEADLGVDVIAHLPHDPTAAETLRVGGVRGRLGRSRLARASTDLASLIQHRLAGDPAGSSAAVVGDRVAS